MGRRSDPELIFEAQRAGVRARLTGIGMQPETADRWLDTWVLEATGRGLPKDGRYWQAGWDWIGAERAVRRPGWGIREHLSKLRAPKPRASPHLRAGAESRRQRP